MRESNASKLCFPFADFPLSRFSWFPRGHLYPCDCCRTYIHHLRPFSHLLISFFDLCRPSRLARPPILDDLRFESLPFVLPSSDRSQRNLPFTEPSLTIILDPQTFFWHLSSDFVLDPIPFVLALAFVFSFLAWLTTLVLFLSRRFNSSLAEKAVALRRSNGEDPDDYEEWKGVKVGKQVLM